MTPAKRQSLEAAGWKSTDDPEEFLTDVMGQPKLDWQESHPSKDRYWVDVPEGQIFFDVGYKGKVFVPLLACRPGEFGILPREWIGREFASVDEAKREIQTWYTQHKEQA
jgi:hypothetical protein